MNLLITMYLRHIGHCAQPIACSLMFNPTMKYVRSLISPVFTDEETGAQTSSVTYPRPDSQKCVPIKPVSFKAQDLSCSTPFQRCSLAFEDYNSEECPNLEFFNSKTCIFHIFESYGIRMVSQLMCTDAGPVVFLPWPSSAQGCHEQRQLTVHGFAQSRVYFLSYIAETTTGIERLLFFEHDLVLLDGNASLLQILLSCQSSSAQLLFLHVMLRVFLSHEANGQVL